MSSILMVYPTMIGIAAFLLVLSLHAHTANPCLQARDEACFRAQWRELFSLLHPTRKIDSMAYRDRAWATFGVSENERREAGYRVVYPYLKTHQPSLRSYQERFRALMPKPQATDLIGFPVAVDSSRLEDFVPGANALFNFFQYDLGSPDEELKLETFLEEESAYFDGKNLWKKSELRRFIHILKETFAHSTRFYRAYKPLSWSYGCGELSSVFAPALIGCGYAIDALSPGSHTVLRARIGGNEIIIDLTVWQYSGINLPLITTRRLIGAENILAADRALQGFQMPWYPGYHDPSHPNPVYEDFIMKDHLDWVINQMGSMTPVDAGLRARDQSRARAAVNDYEAKLELLGCRRPARD